MKLQKLLLLIFLFSLSNSGFAAQDYQSKYLGQESRTIKSLSPEDIQELENGKGWGLAKAAELNGIPGPAHILQMKEKINLTAEQTRQIEQLFERMKQEAIPLGKQLIQLEKELNLAFAQRSIDAKQLQAKLDEIAALRSRLRYVHLSTHLETPAILSARQISHYNQLRGYQHTDPCNTVPHGHDAAMWKKHNGCS